MLKAGRSHTSRHPAPILCRVCQSGWPRPYNLLERKVRFLPVRWSAEPRAAGATPAGTLICILHPLTIRRVNYRGDWKGRAGVVCLIADNREDGGSSLVRKLEPNAGDFLDFG